MNTLYENLMALCENNDTPFYYSDQSIVPGEYYRIFSYHFTDKDSWMLPDALEARGIMFEVTRDGEPLRIAARPMQKFFNKGEVDFIDYGVPEYVMNKVDGSLISSYKDKNGIIRLKSKTSIGSEYAELAMQILANDSDLKLFVMDCEQRGYTVNMELISPVPKFRIVLYYPVSRLVVLNARHRYSGEYLPMAEIPCNLFAGNVDHDVLNHLDTATNVEGYIVIDDKKNWWKEKCKWYLERHRAKDFVNQPLAFVELVLKDEADDVFALLEDQPEILKEMQDLQHKVISFANKLVNTVNGYYEANKHLDRKDYAIKGQEELSSLEFALAMMHFGKDEEPNYKAVLLKSAKKVNWGNL